MKRRAIKLRADAPYHALQAARTRGSQADWPLPIISERALKAPSRKGFEALACAVRATWA